MKKNKQLTCLALVAAITVSTNINTFAAAAATQSFTDVPSSHWSYSNVEKAVSEGLVNGVGNNKFEPDRSVNNAEWAVMAVKTVGINYDATTYPKSVWWQDPLRYARTGNWLKNTTLGESVSQTIYQDYSEEMMFAPISRYDMAQTIYNFNKSQAINLQVDTTGIAEQIYDYKQIPTKYRDAVEYCYASGLIVGVDEKGSFDGTSPMTRGASATVLVRLLEVKNGTWVIPDRKVVEVPTTTPNTTTPTVTENSSPVINTNTTTVTPTAVKDMISLLKNTRTSFNYEIKVNNKRIEGKLTNGKGITDENITAMINELKAVFPNGTPWTDDLAKGDSYFYNSKSFGSGGACNAFAYMTFDVLFGEGRYTRSKDLTQMKMGDVIQCIDENNESRHWIVVQEVEGFKDVMGLDLVTYELVPRTVFYFTRCEGNLGGKVNYGMTQTLTQFLGSYPNSVLYSAY